MNLGSKYVITEDGSELIITKYNEEIEIVIRQHSGQETYANLTFSELVQLSTIIQDLIEELENE
jgi:hypothetical protein